MSKRKRRQKSPHSFTYDEASVPPGLRFAFETTSNVGAVIDWDAVKRICRLAKMALIDDDVFPVVESLDPAQPFEDFDRAMQAAGVRAWLRPWMPGEREELAEACRQGVPVPANYFEKWPYHLVKVVRPHVRVRVPWRLHSLIGYLEPAEGGQVLLTRPET